MSTTVAVGTTAGTSLLFLHWAQKVSDGKCQCKLYISFKYALKLSEDGIMDLLVPDVGQYVIYQYVIRQYVIRQFVIRQYVIRQCVIRHLIPEKMFTKCNSKFLRQHSVNQSYSVLQSSAGPSTLSLNRTFSLTCCL